MRPVHVVTGASRGIGLALCREILHRTRDAGGIVVGAARDPAASSGLAALAAASGDRLHTVTCDVTDPTSVKSLASSVSSCTGGSRVSLLMNVAGVLHELGAPEKSLAAVDAEVMARVHQINAIGPVIVTQALHRMMAEGAVVANLSARVGSIGDNGLGGWWSYRRAGDPSAVLALLSAAARTLAQDVEGRAQHGNAQHEH